MTKLTTAAFIVASVVALANPAHAAPLRIVIADAKLSYSTAELETADGARGLLARIDRLALQLCRPGMKSVYDRPNQARIAECRVKAVARAVEKLDAPLVTAAHAQRQQQLAAR